MRPLVANFLRCISAKNYEYRLTHVQGTSEDKMGTFEAQCSFGFTALRINSYL